MGSTGRWVIPLSVSATVGEELVGQVESSVTLSRATSIVGKARPFGSRCASATLCCVSCQGRGHCLRNAP